jgi:serine/threonine protein kinase
MGYKKGEELKTAFEIYKIGVQRGAGGSGEVYEIFDSTGRVLAAKILNTASAPRNRLQRFKREIEFCSKNVCRNIVPVLDHGVTAKGASFYVMPLYTGTLRELMSKRLPPTAVLPYFSQILDAMEIAHQLGVTHRDLKPANILISVADGKTIVVVADFGIAHFEEEELLTAVETKSQERLANFEYAAPEQRRRGPVDGKADIYALGLILNEMFTGSVPQGTGFRMISEVDPNSAYLDGLVELMIRQDPVARPTVEDVKRELIARGNAFVAVQNLNAAKTAVIPETEVDDPFITNPIKIIGADYQNGWIVYKLSATPPPGWVEAFRNPQFSRSGYLGKGPETFDVTRDTALVQLNERQGETLEEMTIHAKEYVELANRRYALTLSAEHKRNIQLRQEAQKKAIQQAEERRRMLAKIAEMKF